MGKGTLTTEKWYDEYTKGWRLYPHLIVRRNIKLKVWKCDYCGEEGNMDELGKIGCTERSNPCKWCGRAPLCTPDCMGIKIALSDPKVVVIGGKENLFEKC